jgi:hypothetical protein
MKLAAVFCVASDLIGWMKLLSALPFNQTLPSARAITTRLPVFQLDDDR